MSRLEVTDLEFDSVVILSPFYWNFRDDIWVTTHHLARQFARVRPTVLVEPGIQWNPWSEQFRLHRLSSAVWGPRIQSPFANLVIFHRRGLPGGRSKSIRDFDLHRNARSLQRLLTQFGFQRTLLWHSFPYWSEPLVSAIPHRFLAYHCLDHATRDEEPRLIRRADAVFCVSETLVETHRRLNSRTYLLPNGVDLDLFNRREEVRQPRPADLPTSRRLIGFVGSINCHVDFDLLLRVAIAFPHDHLVLVGRTASNENAPTASQRAALDQLQSMGNVRFLGFKPTRELPLYLSAFDVCLIPFLGDAFNREADPLKFYEYAAMGKPVVTTPVAVASRYRDLCYIADSPEEFIHGISSALDEPRSEQLCRARVALAQAHSWESLVACAAERLKVPVGQGSSPEAEYRP